MEQREIKTPYRSLHYSDLEAGMQRLVDEAKAQTKNSYARYSKFHVGAAVLLENGEIVAGSNQENVAYPSGLCAERTAMFYANSRYPEVKPIAIAVAAFNEGKFLEHPITPCGGCLQVLLESENRFGSPIKVILYGEKEIYVIEKIGHMLPFAFTSF